MLWVWLELWPIGFIELWVWLMLWPIGFIEHAVGGACVMAYRVH